MSLFVSVFKNTCPNLLSLNYKQDHVPPLVHLGVGALGVNSSPTFNLECFSCQAEMTDECQCQLFFSFKSSIASPLIAPKLPNVTQILKNINDNLKDLLFTKRKEVMLVDLPFVRFGASIFITKGERKHESKTFFLIF